MYIPTRFSKTVNGLLFLFYCLPLAPELYPAPVEGRTRAAVHSTKFSEFRAIRDQLAGLRAEIDCMVSMYFRGLCGLKKLRRLLVMTARCEPLKNLFYIR